MDPPGPPLPGFNFALNTSGNSSSSPESIADDSIEIDNFSVSLELENNMEEDAVLVENMQNQLSAVAGVEEANDVDLNSREHSEERAEQAQAVVEAAVAAVEMQEAENEDQMQRFGSSSSDPHPLLVPNVIRDILQKLSINEIMKSRLVCHQWNEEACRIIQKAKTITFTDNIAITTYMKYYPSPAAEDSRLSRPMHLEYQMYKIDFAESNGVLQSFFGSHGSHIVSLILQQSSPIQERELYEAIANHLPSLEELWLRFVPISSLRRPFKDKDSKEKFRMGILPPLPREYSFPTIKKLTLGTQSFVARDPGIGGAILQGAEGGAGGANGNNGNGNGNGDGDDDDYQIQLNNVPTRGDELTIRACLVRLLSSLPNLQTIRVTPLDNWCDCVISQAILRAIIEVPDDRLRHLVNLEFPLHLTQPLLEGFNAMSFNNLNELNMHIGRNVEVPATRQLFLAVGPRLQGLSISLPNDFSYSKFIRIPGHEMRRLKHLKLSRYRWSLDFLESLTLLDTLVCTDMPIPTIFPISMRHEHNLTSLKIQGKDYPIRDSEVVSRVTRAFPKLRILHIPGVNDDGLRMIYTDLPYLTNLACTDGEFTDCGISGVSLEVCNDLAETMTYLFVNPDKFRRDLFIGNLTNLTHLRLESPSMTHLSVLFGIVKCTKIEHLHLRSEKIHDAAIESIADQMLGSLKILNAVQCPAVTEAGKFFARERIPNLKVYVCGDVVEDPEHMERLKLQTMHAHFDAFSRRRARDRHDVVRDREAQHAHRRRIAYRIIQQQRMQNHAQLEQQQAEAAMAALAEARAPLAAGVDADDDDDPNFFEERIHAQLHALEEAAGEGDGIDDFDNFEEFVLPAGDFYGDDDDSSSEGENEMNFVE